MNAIKIDIKKYTVRLNGDTLVVFNDGVNTLQNTEIGSLGILSKLFMLQEVIAKIIPLAYNDEPNFINDVEKMHDFVRLTEKEFMTTYSYLTKEEYRNTSELYTLEIFNQHEKA
jgi:hypothetical protein